MRSRADESPYDNCVGLRREMLAEYLRYDPDSGLLSWIGRRGRGGTGSGTTITRTRLVFLGAPRNTFGIICLLHAGRLPARKILFRDGSPANWSWANIRPDGWL